MFLFHSLASEIRYKVTKYSIVDASGNEVAREQICYGNIDSKCLCEQH
jgi:hypothetical protein